MTDINEALAALKHRIAVEPAVPIETAAKLCSVSSRTIRRHIHKFEVKRDRRRHIFITLRSIKHFIEFEQYQPSTLYDVRKTPKEPGASSVPFGSNNRNAEANR